MIENIFDILDNLFRFISAIITIKNRNQNTKKKLSANECQIKLEVDQL